MSGLDGIGFYVFPIYCVEYDNIEIASTWCDWEAAYLIHVDKIRPQYVRQKDMKDTIGRYIVLLPEEKVDSCLRDSEW